MHFASMEMKVCNFKQSKRNEMVKQCLRWLHVTQVGMSKNGTFSNFKDMKISSQIALKVPWLFWAPFFKLFLPFEPMWIRTLLVSCGPSGALVNLLGLISRLIDRVFNLVEQNLPLYSWVMLASCSAPRLWFQFKEGSSVEKCIISTKIADLFSCTSCHLIS